MTISKTIIGKQIAAELNISAARGQQAMAIVCEMIAAELISGRNAALKGFGTFVVRKRGARQGVNPKTKERIAIPASIGVSFRASPALKERLNPTRMVGADRGKMRRQA